MKKCLSLLMVVCLLLGLSVPAFAQYVEKKDLGLITALSDNWVSRYNSDGLAYEHKTTNEYITVDVFQYDYAYSWDWVDIDQVRQTLKNYYSNWEVSQRLSEQNNNVYISVKENYASDGFEYINGIQYYKYEKVYTASATGYYTATFYDYTYLTVQNGFLYEFQYSRRSSENNFKDFYNMLSVTSYDLGKIKIQVNGQQVYSDAAPIAIEGRTLVPIRAVAESLGYTVSWDPQDQLVILEGRAGDSLIFGLGSSVGLKNRSEEIVLEVAPIALGGRTYLPLRAVAEAMNASVNWDGNSRTVVIYK